MNKESAAILNANTKAAIHYCENQTQRMGKPAQCRRHEDLEAA